MNYTTGSSTKVDKYRLPGDLYARRQGDVWQVTRTDVVLAHMAPESPTKTQDIWATTDEVTALRAAGVEVVPAVTDRGDRATQSGSSPPTIKVQAFKSVHDTVGRISEHAWSKVWAELIRREHPSKEACPMFSPGIFDGPIKGRIPVEFWFVVGEHDAGTVSVDEARRRAEAANLRCGIFSTASHSPEAPRWRVVCPLPAPVDAARYPDLVETLNGALGGCLAPESMDLSRRWFFGRVAGTQFESASTDGVDINVAAIVGLVDQLPIAAAAKTVAKREPFEPLAVEELTDEQVEDVTSALMFRKPDGKLALDPDDRPTWIKIIQNGKRHPQLREPIRQWSALSSLHTDEEFDRKFDEPGGDRSDYRSIISAAQAEDWPNPKSHRLQVIDISGLEDLSLPAVPISAESALVPVPVPFRGPMAAAVAAAVAVAPKQQPELTTLAALVGMAACIPGHYRLPSGARLNLYGLGVLETGGGKDLPRRVAVSIAHKGGAAVIGRAASGQGLEDALVDGHGMLCEIDEIAHTLQAANERSAPPHLVEMSRVFLALFSASSGRYHCRVRANGKPSATATPRSIANPCLSLLGFATPEKLGEALGVSNIEDGLLGRMLFVEGRPSVKQRVQKRAFTLPSDFTRYREQFAPSLGVDGQEVVVRWGAGVEERFDVLVDEFNTGSTSTSPFAKALQARAYEKTERIAGVLAVFDDPVTPVISLAHVDWAEAFVRASNAALLRFAGGQMHAGQVQANAARLLGLIDRIVSGEIKVQTSVQTDLVRKGFAPRTSVLKASKLSKREFDEAVEHLIACGDAEVGEANDSGRKVGAIRRATE
jgi:hypothetical protein